MLRKFAKKMRKLSTRILRPVRQFGTEKSSLSIVVLNWNRKNLLEKTINSLLMTATNELEFYVIDNGSSDGSKDYLAKIAKQNSRITPVYLSENKGGEAFNEVLPRLSGRFILISENDLEYKPGWFEEMIQKFDEFPELGQLSPFSPFPDAEAGELWVVKEFDEIKKSHNSLYLACGNVGTSSLIRREIISRGVRFKNIVSQDGKSKMPADGDFSADIKRLGYQCAWSTKANVINWGHNKKEWQDHPAYYEANRNLKAELNIDGLEKLKSIKAKLLELSPEAAGEKLFSILGECLSEIESLKSRYRILQKSVNDRELVRRLGVLKEKSYLYVDTGKGFLPEQCVIVEFDPLLEKLDLEFDISRFAGIKALRWDPIHREPCRIKLEKVILKGTSDLDVSLKYIELSEHSKSNDGWVNFKTSAPQVKILILESRPFHTLRLSGAYK